MILHLLGYVPFIDPLPIWVRPWIWPVLLLPLCLALSVVYKSIRCREMREVPRQSLELFLTIVLSMAAAAVALTTVARLLD